MTITTIIMFCRGFAWSSPSECITIYNVHHSLIKKVDNDDDLNVSKVYNREILFAGTVYGHMHTMQ